jgi:hypothetical protein
VLKHIDLPFPETEMNKADGKSFTMRRYEFEFCGNVAPSRSQELKTICDILNCNFVAKFRIKRLIKL